MNYRVTASALNLRSGPGTDFPVLEKLPHGARVEAAAVDWVFVRVGGRTGWVHADYLATMGVEPSWLSIARKELGVAEVPGVGNNERILEYHGVTTLRATADSVPWCSSFACWVIERAGYKSTRSAAARSWLQWGRAIDQPVEGCIVVLKRGAPPSGHVGFYVGGDANRVRLLGGNQGDRVSEAFFPRADVLGYRMPIDDAPHLRPAA